MNSHNDISCDDTTRTTDSAPITRSGRQRRAIALVAVGLMTLAACGTSEGSAKGRGDGVASVGDVETEATSDSGDTGDAGDDKDTDGESSDAATDEQKDPELVYADWEQCMKDEGVDMSIFNGPEGGNAVESDSVSSVDESGMTMPPDFDMDAMEAASEVCDPIMEGFDPLAGMTPEQKAATEDWMVDIENCMKDKGFDVPMTETMGGNTLGDDEDMSSITMPADTDYEAMDEAFKECDEEIGTPPELEDLFDS